MKSPLRAPLFHFLTAGIAGLAAAFLVRRYHQTNYMTLVEKVLKELEILKRAQESYANDQVAKAGLQKELDDLRAKSAADSADAESFRALEPAIDAAIANAMATPPPATAQGAPEPITPTSPTLVPGGPTVDQTPKAGTVIEPANPAPEETVTESAPEVVQGDEPHAAA